MRGRWTTESTPSLYLRPRRGRVVYDITTTRLFHRPAMSSPNLIIYIEFRLLEKIADCFTYIFYKFDNCNAFCMHIGN